MPKLGSLNGLLQALKNPMTGLEACQCRTSCTQRNHIGCALWVWIKLKALATITEKTIY